MIYNIHPIFVHFPIALLFIYSIVKILPFKKWLPKVTWNYFEIILLSIGVVGAFVASSTGEMVEHLVKNKQLVETHSTFASISTIIFCSLLVGEILSFLTVSFIPIKLNLPKINNIFVYIQKILTHHIFSKILAFLGLIAITITVMLGGIIVYGVSADPLAAPLLNLLNIAF
jgi:hypothetical protein